MWEYQTYCQTSLQGSAKTLFDKIDPALNPKIILIGFIIESKNDSFPICIEPEDSLYSPKIFDGVEALANRIRQNDPGNNIFHSHPVSQSSHDNALVLRSKIEAIKKILNLEDQSQKTEKFVSHPMLIEGYEVYVVLELNKNTFNKYYSLKKEEIDRVTVRSSFIQTVAKVFLNEAKQSLRDYDRPIDYIERSDEELLREAGKKFMLTISYAGRNFYGLHGLYDAVNIISSLKYEGKDNLGKMIIAHKGHPNISMTLELLKPIYMSDFRAVRKFLEISNESSIIISDSHKIYGLGEITGEYDILDESLYAITFLSNYTWAVYHGHQPLMVVEYGLPNVFKNRLNKKKFSNTLKRKFLEINKNQIDNLVKLAEAAILQKSGTMIIISENAIAESARLSGDSFPISPVKLTPESIKQFTTIDGSVLIDKDGICYSIGVILDGLASSQGDSSRGSRYNSAIRYFEHNKKLCPTVVLIISEDGMIDLVPDLRPQIKHSTLSRAINKLKEFSSMDKLNDSNWKKFHQNMNFLESVEFYLTGEECETINSHRKLIEDKNLRPGMKIVRNDLVPNNEMDESYYF